VLHAGVEKALSKVARLADSNGDVQGSQALGRLLNRADKLSQERGDAYISSDVVLLAMVEKNAALSALIRDAGLTEASLKKAIEDVHGVRQSNQPMLRNSAKLWRNTRLI
jgi:ATP-dependent Clp protease ATP-binding subunit ClpB